VFPVSPGGKLPLIPTAHPKGDPQAGKCHGECGRQGHGLYDAVTDHKQIDKWWSRTPEANVAIATGAPGPDVLDVDVHNGAPGWQSYNQLRAAGLVPGAMAEIRTPSGGGHFYYQGTDQRNGMLAIHRDGKTVSLGIDYRGAGGYVVAPPSQVEGRSYVVVSRQPSAATFDLDAARQHLIPQSGRSPRREWASAADGREQDLSHLVRYVAECTDHVNDRLFWAACRMVEAGRDDQLPDLVRAAYAAGEDRRGQAERTVQSALRSTQRLPASPAEPRPFARAPQRQQQLEAG
jgi:hypothetical protein